MWNLQVFEVQFLFFYLLKKILTFAVCQILDYVRTFQERDKQLSQFAYRDNGHRGVFAHHGTFPLGL